MTAEQLEELLEGGDWSQVRWDTLDAMLKTIRKLERRVLASEKLVDDAENVMHELLVTSSWSSDEVNKLLSEITAYREASK